MNVYAAPRWRGEPGRLEVWYATLSDPVTRAGLWVHYETVAPVANPPYGHGWVTWFPAAGSPHTERFGPEHTEPTIGAAWFDVAGERIASEELAGRAGALAWDLRWQDTSAPLWTFPRVVWERELLPGAQVVLAPTAVFTGSLTVGDTSHRLDGWRGAVAHIYAHGNAKRWGWIHADLGGGDVLEVVTAVSQRPGMRKLPPIAFVRFRIDGKDWPASPLPSLRMRTTLGLRHWQLEGGIEAMGRLLFAAGAVEVLTGAPAGNTVTSVSALQDVLGRTNPKSLHLAAFHPTDSTAAGADAQLCPVDETGRLRGVDGVWVADGSILPSCSEVNPQVSIMALALAVADEVVTARR